MRQLYIGYIRAKLDYCNPIQNVANKTAIQDLDKIQNQGLRLICGAMKSTPIAACEIEANIEPLDIRRQRSLVEAVERFHRAEPDHPNRKLVEKWKSNKRIQQQSPLEVHKTVSLNQHLPTNRKNESRFAKVTPWNETGAAEIKTSLTDINVNKNSMPHILKATALETIDS